MTKKTHEYLENHEEALFWLKEYQKGDTNAWSRLEPYVKKAIRAGIGSYYVAGFDSEDLYQEVLLNLLPYLKKIKIDKEKGTLFSMLVVCAKRRMITIIKLNSNNKHKTLNNALSIDSNANGLENKSYANILEDRENNTPRPVLSEEFLESIRMSPLENNCLRMWRGGYTYDEIAEKNNVNIKVVDNALQRVKMKIKRLLKDDTITN